MGLKGKQAAVCLFLAAATMLRAGDGILTASNNVPTNHEFSCRVSTNALWLWLDLPTNATPTKLLFRADITATNFSLPLDKESITLTASKWRTLATLGLDLFHVEHPEIGFPDNEHRSGDGLFHEVGFELIWDIDPDEPGLIGVGVSVGRAATRFP